nr:MAG TPA: hypothetical protein [Caudoviricetes sp.]
MIIMNNVKGKDSRKIESFLLYNKTERKVK